MSSAERKRETLTPIQITSALPYELETFQKCWNVCDGWLRLIGNKLELAVSLERETLLAILSTSRSLHGMMVQVQVGRASEGVIK